MDTPERRVWGERRPKDRVTLHDLTLMMDLHAVYMAINTYTHNTGTKQSIIMSNKFQELWVVST